MELNPSAAITGMALGVDQWAAEVCIELGIPFTAAIPFPGQESKWPLESRELYKEILAKARYWSVIGTAYSPSAMQIRNQWMVDRCNLLIAVWDGSSGGTANCVAYAKSVGCKIHRINPKDF